MRLYNLTEYTGQKSADERTMTIQTFTVRPKVLLHAGVAVIPALLLAAVSWIVISVYAVIVFALTWAAVFWLLTARTTDSRNIPQYKALIDSRQAKNEVGRFFVGPNKIDVLYSVDAVFTPGTTPVGKPDRTVVSPVINFDSDFDDLVKRK